MLISLLAHFPTHTWPLTVVSDPDALLAEESVTAALLARGFRLIDEPDPVLQRLAWAQAQPVSAQTPVIVLTAQPLNTMPYDLWQQGQRVELALNHFFATLDLPTARLLIPEQRWRLGQAYAHSAPVERLSPGASRRYVLEAVFGLRVDALQRPGELLLALAGCYARAEPLPGPLRQELLTALRRKPALSQLPLDSMLESAASFQALVQREWQRTVTAIEEPNAAYGAAATLPFATDPSLQAALAKLLQLDAVSAAHVAVIREPAAAQATAAEAALGALGDLLAQPERRWSDWQEIARRWAQLTRLQIDIAQPLPSATATRAAALVNRIDPLFADWLQHNYAALAGQRMPEPHHLFHMPGVLQRARNAASRVALIVLDGMSLAAWQRIRWAWALRHSRWRMDEQLVLAQVPSVTTISRQALVSGLPPREFANSLTTTAEEYAHWRAFWKRQDPPATAVALDRVSNRTGRTIPVAVTSAQTQALCVILNDIDDMVHGATLGLPGLHASLDLWLREPADTGLAWVEALVQALLDRRIHVAITSDHGHVEAVGVGQPSEGVLVKSRAQRARLYDNEDFAHTVQQDFPDTILWRNDGLLPHGWVVLLPTGRQAFAPVGKRVVSHGGLTIEEMVVPSVTITQVDESR